MARRKTVSKGAAGSGKVTAKVAAPPRSESEPVEKTGAVYQLKITLRDVRPPIWRRVLVKDCSLSRLHEVIQIAMGWDSYHLYSFEVDGIDYGDPDMTGDELDMKDDRRAKLSRLVPGEKFKFRYIYDFGDNWEHEITVEKLLPAEAGTSYPVCVAGKRAGPPEDVGGVWGYMEFVQAMRDPKHPQHRELAEWYGDPFDPEVFDIDEVNRRLAGRG
jgi:hypothetical protein